MAASDNFRLVNSSENAIPKYIPGMAADIKGLREELDKKFEVGVQIDATTRDLIAQAPAGTMGKSELDKIAMQTTQELNEIAKKGDYEHYTRPLMALGRNVHGKLGAIANDAKQEATYYDEVDKYKGWTESQKNDMKTKALVGSKPLQFDEMGRKVGGFKSGENWGDLPDPDEGVREALSLLGPDKYGKTEDVETLYEKWKNGTIYETIGLDKIRQAFDSAAKTPGTKLYQYLDKQSRLQTFANTNGVDDKDAYDFFQNKFTPTGVTEEEIASEQILKDKVLRGEKSPTLALQQLTNKDVYNTLYGNIFNYAATKQISGITVSKETHPSPYQLEELKDAFKQQEEARKAKAEKEKELEDNPLIVGEGTTDSLGEGEDMEKLITAVEKGTKEREATNTQIKKLRAVYESLPPNSIAKSQAKERLDAAVEANISAENRFGMLKQAYESVRNNVSVEKYGVPIDDLEKQLTNDIMSKLKTNPTVVASVGTGKFEGRSDREVKIDRRIPSTTVIKEIETGRAKITGTDVILSDGSKVRFGGTTATLVEKIGNVNKLTRERPPKGVITTKTNIPHKPTQVAVTEYFKNGAVVKDNYGNIIDTKDMNIDWTKLNITTVNKDTKEAPVTLVDTEGKTLGTYRIDLSGSKTMQEVGRRIYENSKDPAQKNLGMSMIRDYSSMALRIPRGSYRTGSEPTEKHSKGQTYKHEGTPIRIFRHDNGRFVVEDYNGNVIKGSDGAPLKTWDPSEAGRWLDYYESNIKD
jgi:hypothetical protein